MINQNIKHIPVMTKELIQSLKIKKNGIYIDSTFGMGGHTKEILKIIGASGKLYSIDRDPNAVNIGKTIQDSRFHIVNKNFSKLLDYATENKITKKVDGIIFDLGTSSLQIDDKKRGFSFKKNGPLDMRMNPNLGISAADWLFKSNINTISTVLKQFGEERFSKRIAYAIKYQNKIQKIRTTFELVNTIKKAIPVFNKFKHPAKRTFQAIRMYINHELDELKTGLDHVLKILKPGGRVSIISFHSLEDRIVKQFMFTHSRPTVVPYGMPITENKLKKLTRCELKIINRILPSQEEKIKNSRSRSSILRTAEMKHNYEI
jgi:16S rRNA (cytosine1402-N4)-methyltransferase